MSAVRSHEDIEVLIALDALEMIGGAAAMLTTSGT